MCNGGVGRQVGGGVAISLVEAALRLRDRPRPVLGLFSGPVGGITAEVVRGFEATLDRLGPASRARKQAALASFLE